jgi:hypothetical protein
MFFYVHTNNQKLGEEGVSTSEIKTWGKLLSDFVSPPQTLKFLILDL